MVFARRDEHSDHFLRFTIERCDSHCAWNVQSDARGNVDRIHHATNNKRMKSAWRNVRASTAYAVLTISIRASASRVTRRFSSSRGKSKALSTRRKVSTYRTRSDTRGQTYVIYRENIRSINNSIYKYDTTPYVGVFLEIEESSLDPPSILRRVSPRCQGHRVETASKTSSVRHEGISRRGMKRCKTTGERREKDGKRMYVA